MHQRPEFAQRLGGRILGPMQLWQSLVRVDLQRPLGHPQHHHHRDQTVLRSVVQIPLDALEFGRMRVERRSAAGRQGGDALREVRTRIRRKQSRGRPADPFRHRGDQPPRDQEVQDADQRHSGSAQPRRHGVRVVDGFARGHLLPVQRDGNRIERTEWQSNGQHRRDESTQTMNRQPGRVAPRRLIGEEPAPVPECRIAGHRWVSLQNRASGVRSGAFASQAGPPPEHSHVRRQQQPADDQNRERQQNETDHQQEQGNHSCRALDEHVHRSPGSLLHCPSMPHHTARSTTAGYTIDSGLCWMSTNGESP